MIAQKTNARYHFDKSYSERVKKFIRNLTHTKGEWAGEPFTILPWEEKIIDDVFGTFDENGRRRYRIVYIEIPKKNGKTELGAAIALYMLTADGEKSPEVYSAAADKDQAGLIYDPAAIMVEKNPTLSKRLKIRRSRKRIINERKNGFYAVLSSDVATKHGLNPSCVLFDELHAQKTDDLWRVLTAGTDYARSQQLIFVFTTAGIYDVESIWWKIRKKAMQVAAGIVEDDSFYPVLYIADPEKDEPEDENLWERVNPSLGRIFTIDKIRRDFQKSKQDPIEYQDFKRFRLNIPIKQTRRWLDMKEWDACKGKIDLEDLKKKKCYGGIDLSATQDLTAFALVFPGIDEPWRVIGKAYCPEDTILDKSRQDKVHYDIWAEQGYITATPGNYIDKSYIKKDVIAASEIYDLDEVGFDPYGATDLASTLLNKYGITMVEVRQGSITMSPAIKDILRMILCRGIVHDGNPVLRWCIDNAVMIIDANENYRPAKDKSTGRIDLFIALVNAWVRALLKFEKTKESVYEKRGIRSL